MRKCAINFVFSLLMAGVMSSPAMSAQDSGGRGRNPRMFVVPRPGDVVIDGKLDDWDLSGQIESFITRETRGSANARIALMYDTAAIYVSGVVRDASPLRNRHNPAVNPDRAWDADAFQFRLMLDAGAGFPLDVRGDNDQLCSLLLWYYTDAQQPFLQLTYGMKFKGPKAGYPGGIVPADKFQAAYRVWDDGAGYTFEYRIPWSTLEAKMPPKAGDLVAATLQVHWGLPDGLSLISAFMGAAYDLMSSPGFPFQTTVCWGKAIFTARGQLPPALSQPGDDVAVTPDLPLSLRYTLPEDGEVTLALQNADGMDLRRLLAQAPRQAGEKVEAWDGLDDQGKPLPAGTYRWRGLYHQPITTKYLMSVHNSGQPAWVTADGTGAWGADHGVPTAVAALPDGLLLSWECAENKGGVLRVNPDGHRQWGMLHSAIYLATDGRRLFTSGGTGFIDGSGVQAFDVATSQPLVFTRGTPKIEEPAGGDKVSNTVTGLAYGQGVLYVAYAKRNLIGLYDPLTGALTGSYAVPAPRNLAVAPDGRLLAVSEGKVLRVHSFANQATAGGQGSGKTEILAGNFVDKASDKVSDEVSGTMSTDHLDDPQGITVSPAGLIFVANGGKLMNVSVFDASGKYLRSIGKAGGRPAKGSYDKTGMRQPAGIAIDNRGQLWVAEREDSPKRISVWNAKTGECVTEFFGGAHYGTFVSMDPEREDEAYEGNTIWAIDTRKGIWQPKSTMWRATGPNMLGGAGNTFGGLRVLTARDGRQYAWGASGDRGSILFRREGDLFKPIVGVINVTKGNQWIPWPPYPIFDDNTAYPNGHYFWQDANDDQTIQAAELMRTDAFGPFGAVDADLTLYSDKNGGVRLRPADRTADGRPIYDLAKVEKTGVAGAHEFGGLHHDCTDDTLYTVHSDGGLTRYQPDGKRLWCYPTKSWRTALNLPVDSKGSLWGVTSFLGTAGEFTGIATYFGTFHVLTRDGLYVTRLFRDQRVGEMGPDVITCEAFAGQLVRMRQSGRYFLLGGDTDGRISEVLGLDTVKRLPGGMVTLTAADVAAGAAAREEFDRRKTQAQPLILERGRGSLATAKGVSRVLDEQRRFTARAAYDQQNLYVQYDVKSPFELGNAVTDPLILFKGGNALDIQFAADSAADAKRTAPAAGDLRLLVSRQQGKPLAVLYRPKVKGFAGEPKVLKSPTGQESFDCIEVVDAIGLEYRPAADGFTATVIIPLSVLGWQPSPLATVRMDLGYLFGNATGNYCVLRAYWANNSPTAAINNDIPSESRLEPSQWGTATVE